MRKWAIIVLIALGSGLPPYQTCAAGESARHAIGGVVKDALGRPLQHVELTLQNEQGRTVSHARSDKTGRFLFEGVSPGVYAVMANKTGFKTGVSIVTVTGAGAEPIEIAMASETALTLRVTAARARRSRNVISETGNSQYTLTQHEIATLPQGANTPINQVLLQMPGVVQDEDQQVHIAGEHADFQWRINGIMLPLDSSSGFGQVLNSFFIRRISLMDGVLPASYGYRDAAVLDIETIDGCSQPGGNVSFYGGQRETMQPSFVYGGCHGALNYFLTGTFLHDNLGFSSATPGPTPIHNITNQGQGFGYFSYQINPLTKLSLLTGVSVNHSEIPDQPGLSAEYPLAGVDPASYPSTAIDESLDQNYYFAVLALGGVVGPALSYQVAYTGRYSTIQFNPDNIGDLLYQGVASKAFHSDFANSLQTDITYSFGQHEFGAGFYLGEYGVELDDTSLAFPVNSSGHPSSQVPISIVDNLNAINILGGVYLQDIWHISPELILTAGLRWDIVTGLVSGHQLSPRINLLYRPRPDTELHAGFARFFQTPSFETISPRTFALFQNTTAAVGSGSLSLLAERDYYWNAGIVHHFGPHLTLEENAYFRLAHNLIDLGQFGFVPIFSPFNYRNGRIYGAMSSATYNWENFSLWANFTYSVAQGNDVVTGQFNFSPEELSYIANHYIYLDHQQFYTVSGGASYNWRNYRFGITALYGSGLRGGFANTVELPENWQIDLSAQRSWSIPRLGEVQTRIVLINAFDQVNELRNGTGVGIFLPAYGPRRTIYTSVTIPLPPLGHAMGSH